MKRSLLTVAIVLMTTMTFADAHARTKRHILVIGAGTYGREVGDLPNPRRDAELIRTRFEMLGYTVVTAIDADERRTRNQIARFVDDIRQSPGVAIMYFAGHGLQIDRGNFILPAGIPAPSSSSDVERHAIDVGRLMSDVAEAGATASVLLLDACRNNPFASAPWAAGRGLARMTPAIGRSPGSSSATSQVEAVDLAAPEGVAIAFSTQPGELALDGPSGGNSPFASAIAEIIGENPRIRFSKLFEELERRVMAKSGGAQRPWVSSRVVRDAALLGP